MFVLYICTVSSEPVFAATYKKNFSFVHGQNFLRVAAPEAKNGEMLASVNQHFY